MKRSPRLTGALATGIAALALAGGTVVPAGATGTTTSTAGTATTVDVATITSTQVQALTRAAAAQAAAEKAAAAQVAKQKAAAARAAAARRARCSLGASTTGTTCESAIAFMTAQMTSGSTAWHDLCLALVSRAYGEVYAGYPSASSVSSQLAAAGLLHSSSDLSTIPRGAVLWFTNSTGAGHVAISLGNGKAISSDVPNGDIESGQGGVGVVPISWFTDTWGQTFLGWSAPVIA